MKKLIVTFLPAIALAGALTMVIANSASAAPAVPNKGKVCWVQDANMVTFVDDECEYHEVFKYDDAGNRIAVLNYQDHGHLPPEATFPEKTMINVFHVDCGCIYDGDYRIVVTSTGEYHSQGPMVINN